MSVTLLRCKTVRTGEVALEKHLENNYCGDKSAFRECNATCTDGGVSVPKNSIKPKWHFICTGVSDNTNCPKHFKTFQTSREQAKCN